jgi:hypothetical protein
MKFSWQKSNIFLKTIFADTYRGEVLAATIRQFYSLQAYCRYFYTKKELFLLWRAAYAPRDGQTSLAYSSQPVQYLYINQLLSVNKLVLSYLLLRLLPQCHIFFTVNHTNLLRFCYPMQRKWKKVQKNLIFVQKCRAVGVLSVEVSSRNCADLWPLISYYNIMFQKMLFILRLWCISYTSKIFLKGLIILIIEIKRATSL